MYDLRIVIANTGFFKTNFKQGITFLGSQVGLTNQNEVAQTNFR